MNYKLRVYSSIDSTGKPASRHPEKTVECRTVKELTDAIWQVASVAGWRDFEVVTTGDTMEGIPLQ